MIGSVVAAALALALGIASAVQAQESMGACADDVQKYCAGVEPGGGRIGRCLAEHRDGLSGQCQEVLTKLGVLASEVDAACGDDARRLCQGVSPGEGRIQACLTQNMGSLSATCRQMVEQSVSRRQSGQDFVAVCGDDTKRFCADVRPGGGRIARCLADNLAALSPQCRGLILDASAQQ